jgi:hypothetical protein
MNIVENELVIELDAPPPTEPGFYFCYRKDWGEAAYVQIVREADGLAVRHIIGAMTTPLSKVAKWSRRCTFQITE